MCENNEEGGKTSYRLKFLLQTKFSNKLVYGLQKGKLCVVPTPKSSGLTDLVVSGEWWVGEKIEAGRYCENWRIHLSNCDERNNKYSCAFLGSWFCVACA